MKRNFTILLFLIFLIPNIQAQYQWELGSFLGIASYAGEYSTASIPTLKEGGVAFGVQGRYVYNYAWSLRGGVSVGKFKGDDFAIEDNFRNNVRGASFSTNFVELSFVGEWEPLGEKRYLSGVGFKNLISPYFFAGVGLLSIKPKVDFSKTLKSTAYQTRVDKDKNAKYLKGRFSVPFGMGIKFDASEFWNIGIELGVHYAFTDYLDGTSEAGNPEANDWFYSTGISVFYRLKESRKQ